MCRKRVAVWPPSRTVLRYPWVIILDVVEASAKTTIGGPASASGLTGLVEAVVSVDFASSVRGRAKRPRALQAYASSLGWAVLAGFLVLLFIDETMRKSGHDLLAAHLCP
jgi:hypothetical protein